MQYSAPLFVEDLIEILMCHLGISISVISLFGQSRHATATDWEVSFLESMHKFPENKRPVSSHQGKAILKLARKYRSGLAAINQGGMVAIERLLSNPVYHLPPYQSVDVDREVRYLGDNLLGFRFKLTASMKKFVSDFSGGLQRMEGARVDIGDGHMRNFQDMRLWVVAVNRDSLDPIKAFIARENFGFDDGVIEYLTLATNNLDADSTIVSDNTSIVVQVCDDELLGWSLENVLLATIV